MSSPPFDSTIDLAPRASLRALTLLFWLHVAVLAGLMIALSPGPAMAGLAALSALSWLWTRRHPAFGFGPRALTRLTWHADGTWTVHNAAGASSTAELLGNTLVHEYLLVLNFQFQDGRRRTRALLGDELDTELLRRLRGRLRLERGG